MRLCDAGRWSHRGQPLDGETVAEGASGAVNQVTMMSEDCEGQC
jgi:hypothetical protein